MQKAKVKGEVNVYMEFINHLGNVTDRCLIATFRNESWADAFLKSNDVNAFMDVAPNISRLVKEIV